MMPGNVPPVDLIRAGYRRFRKACQPIDHGTVGNAGTIGNATLQPKHTAET
jgi:hypothetical protein